MGQRIGCVLEDFLMLAITLLLAGAAVIGFVIWNETSGKARRRRRVERKHLKSKVRDPSR